jgi:hypothetical protein
MCVPWAPPDEHALEKGDLVPLWKMFVAEVRTVIDAADAVDRAMPAMEQAGVAALDAGAPDSGGLVQKVWLAMSALRGR